MRGISRRRFVIERERIKSIAQDNRPGVPVLGKGRHSSKRRRTGDATSCGRSRLLTERGNVNVRLIRAIEANQATAGLCGEMSAAWN